MRKRLFILTVFLLSFCNLNAFLYEEALADEGGKLENASYFVDNDGKMVQNSWVYIDESRNSAGDFEEGWYYFGENGEAYHRENNNFKKMINGYTYIFNEDGLMLTGWFDNEGYSINGLDDPFVEGIYFSREDGALFKEQWLDYGDIGYGIGGSNLYNTIRNSCYCEYDKMWMYFDRNCKKIYSKGDNYRIKNIGGIEYGFDQNGIVDSGWSLWRMIPKNEIIKIGGKYYAFDILGEKKTGFVLFDGRSEFKSQYDVDDFSSDDFKEGSINDIEDFDMYLFSQAEADDGAMQIGKEIKVDLNDGVYTFGFSDNGKAFGNRNKLQRKDDMYYINGLRLEADKEYGYGVVEVRKNNDVYYKVVDTNGKIVKGNKKAVKDKDGYCIIINDKFVMRVGDEIKPKWRNKEEGTGFYYYDIEKSNEEEFIAGYETVPSLEDLPEEERLNF
nr:cell surface protein [uncultured Clostridium sp.]